MPIQTQTVWNWPVASEAGEAIRAEMPFHLDKQTQSMVHIPGPGADQMTVTRWWVDEESANTWLAFVAQFNPVSSEIIK